MISKRTDKDMSNEEREKQVYAFLATQGRRIETTDLECFKKDNTYAAVIGADGYKVFDMPDQRNPMKVRKGSYSLDVFTEIYDVLTHSGRNRHTIDYHESGHVHIDDPVSFMVLGIYELNQDSHLKHILTRLKSGEKLGDMIKEAEDELEEAEAEAAV